MNLAFGLADYDRLLDGFVSRGFSLAPASAMTTEARTLFLRHDVDFSIELSLGLARHEARRGVRSTYFIMLSGPYNAAAGVERRAMVELRNLGHDIGLHYDLSLYPEDAPEAAVELDAEVARLASLSAGPVRSVCMHNPHAMGGDLFRTHDRYLHPHAPRFQDVVYVSDSCRQFLPTFLQRAELATGPVLMNTHPESWLDGTVVDGIEYLDKVLVPRVGACAEHYFRTVVREKWLEHRERDVQQGEEQP